MWPIWDSTVEGVLLLLLLAADTEARLCTAARLPPACDECNQVKESAHSSCQSCRHAACQGLKLRSMTKPSCTPQQHLKHRMT